MEPPAYKKAAEFLILQALKTGNAEMLNAIKVLMDKVTELHQMLEEIQKVHQL